MSVHSRVEDKWANRAARAVSRWNVESFQAKWKFSRCFAVFPSICILSFCLHRLQSASQQKGDYMTRLQWCDALKNVAGRESVLKSGFWNLLRAQPRDGGCFNSLTRIFFAPCLLTAEIQLWNRCTIPQNVYCLSTDFKAQAADVLNYFPFRSKETVNRPWELEVKERKRKISGNYENIWLNHPATVRLTCTAHPRCSSPTRRK